MARSSRYMGALRPTAVAQVQVDRKRVLDRPAQTTSTGLKVFLTRGIIGRAGGLTESPSSVCGVGQFHQATRLLCVGLASGGCRNSAQAILPRRWWSSVS